MAAKRKPRPRTTREPGGEPSDELYVGDFEGFVARRNALAKELAAGGDREAAEEVRALKKPGRVAWALNQLSFAGGGLRDELLEAGGQLRDAQERLMAGSAERAELREAGEREQGVVTRALEAVAELSREAGHTLSSAAVERARQTLHAVALDEAVRRDFERHRLTGEHEAAGLQGFSLGAPSPGRRPQGKAPPAKAKGSKESKRRRDELKAAEAEVRKCEKREARAQQEVERAREAAEHAQRDLERAAKDLEKAARATTGARERVEELRGR